MVFPLAQAQEVLPAVPRLHRRHGATTCRCGPCCARRRRCRSCRRSARQRRRSSSPVFSPQKPDAVQGAIEPLRGFGQPLGEHIGAHAVRSLAAGVRSAADAGRAQLLEVAQLHRAERRGDRRRPRLRRQAADRRSRRSSSACSAARPAAPAADATAYPHREALFAMNVHTRWKDPAEDASVHRLGARVFQDAPAPHAAGGVYVNFLTAGRRRAHRRRVRRRTSRAWRRSRRSTTRTTCSAPTRTSGRRPRPRRARRAPNSPGSAG